MLMYAIYYHDLRPSARIELCKALNTDPEDENWDTIPLAIIDREENNPKQPDEGEGEE